MQCRTTEGLLQAVSVAGTLDVPRHLQDKERVIGNLADASAWHHHNVARRDGLGGSRSAGLAPMNPSITVVLMEIGLQTLQVLH